MCNGVKRGYWALPVLPGRDSRGAGGVYGPRPALECVLQTTDARQRIGPVERSKSYQYHQINLALPLTHLG